MEILNKYFGLKENNTSVRQEFLAALTTFLTMAYIIIVNPKIMAAAGLPEGPAMAATIISAFFGTFIMGVYAKRPIAIAPYMGENAFIAYTVCGVMGYSWQTALGAIFIGGLIFAILTVAKIRTWFANSIPFSLRISFAVGIGMFLTFIGLKEIGVVTVGNAAAPLHVGKLDELKVLLGIVGFVLTTVLMIRKVNTAILLGIVIITVLSIATGESKLPTQYIGMPPNVLEVAFQLDISGALTWGFFSVILSIFTMAFVDTIGTLMALGYKAKMLDEKGEFPQIEKPMLTDALTTMVAALLGTTTAGAYIESATGIQSGGRTGLTAVFISLLFLMGLFFFPVVEIIPPSAYGPSLIIVGILMMSAVTSLNFDDMSETVPLFATVLLMSFTFNIGIGMTAGFVLYPLFKLLSGKAKEIKPGMWILFGFSLLFYIFYPY
ncbi:MAG: NCS2 family permease [Ignavibacteriaceae bacterium]|nr:NCS2 family permease [Ignavibacteriaceae bacterium]